MLRSCDIKVRRNDAQQEILAYIDARVTSARCIFQSCKLLKLNANALPSIGINGKQESTLARGTYASTSVTGKHVFDASSASSRALRIRPENSVNQFLSSPNLLLTPGASTILPCQTSL